MRLLKIEGHGDLSQVERYDDDTPRYGILSHTWGTDGEEVTFRDLVEGTGRDKAGYQKIEFCREQAASDDLQYFWVDTCCIDKSSSAELTEAINSMFRWYQNAEKCYVWLSDVSTPGHAMNGQSLPITMKEAFRRSRWFTRAWTLQELIAPASVEFFSNEGDRLGSKRSLELEIHDITGIAIEALRGKPLTEFEIEKRLSWANHRGTKRPEDKAYSLLGIFDIHMPLLYGEGREKALARLWDEIDKRSLKYSLDEPRNDQLASLNTTRRFETSHRSTSKSVPFERKPHISSDNSELRPLGETSVTNESLCYHPLAEFGFRIFILEPGSPESSIVGHIREFGLLDPPTYYALSYVWGPEPMIHRIVVDGRARFIQPNLFHALQRLRPRTGQLHIWIDSLCINQDDHFERNLQVRQMAKIYHRASGVLIWLGEEDSTSKIAIEFVSQIILSDFQWDVRWWEQYDFTALALVLERPWFRRGWVLQEAAFAKNSIIHCGDRHVHMDRFVLAIDSVRARLSTIQPSSTREVNTMQTTILANFHESPAVRLLDTIEGSFRKSAEGDILDGKMSLETLVDLSTYSETTDQRDTIYALLNLANDIDSLPRPDESDAIIPDYGKDVLDVFVDFIMHCCFHSNSLDIICRPWAPVSSPATYPIGQNNRLGHRLRIYPSWIASRDNLPFGNPSWRFNYRLYGNPLVGGTQKRAYNAHYGSKPHVFVGRNEDGTCDGSLHARGIILGEVTQRSTRLANAIITKECLRILGAVSRKSHSSVIHLPDTIRRTLCADRNEKGEPASRIYRVAMLHLLQISSETSASGDTTDLLDRMSSIDVEDLLETELPDHVKEFLKVIRDVLWNRRTFRSESNVVTNSPLVGLILQRGNLGDQICILHGCSVPIVLRKLPVSVDRICWQLIGDAYVHGIMDGELIQSALTESLRCAEVEFEIR
jgi:Heterokaryon incompatibility protein (HET)